MINENIIGIISDTHDHRKAISLALDAFNKAGCSLVIHAGDFVAPFTSLDFMKLEGRFAGVFGNNDGEKHGLREKFKEIGVITEPPCELTHYGKKIAVMHEPVYLNKFLSRKDIDLIVYGHIHKLDIRAGKPMVINPGECCSWLTGHSTIVILDLDTMNPEVIELNV
ncbi:MAG: metallophosphoesterase [Candidatus Latescibacterota bacterium]